MPCQHRNIKLRKIMWQRNDARGIKLEWQQKNRLQEGSMQGFREAQGGVLHLPEVSWEETILRLHERSKVSYKGKLLPGGS